MMSDVICKHGNLTRSCMWCDMDRITQAASARLRNDPSHQWMFATGDPKALKQGAEDRRYSAVDDPTGLIESGYRVVDRTVESKPSEQCDDCGELYQYNYRVPDDVWKQIAPHQDTLPHFGGLLCLGCADQRARGLGIKLYFEGTPDWWRE